MSADGTSVRDFLAHSGQVGQDLLRVDWAATPLGEPDRWSPSLSTMVRVLLTSRFAMWIAWGPELTFLCNDTYRRDTLGRKYPWALGRPAREVWSEIWSEIEPRIQSVMTTGQSTWDEALLLILERSGYREETYHTFSYSPLPGDDGRVAGMLCVVSEESQRIIGERRMATLRELGSVSSGVQEEQPFLDAACEVLARNPYSLPFTILYLFEEDRTAALACSSGISAGHPAAPAVLAPGAKTPWPLGAVEAGRTVRLPLPAERYGELPTGAWDEPPDHALVVPIPRPGHTWPYGFLVVGLNPYTPYDAAYKSFVELLTRHFSNGIAAARTYETERRRAADLQELDRAKTAFFSNVSHEFRTPLTLMLGPLQDVLGQKSGLDPARVELVHRNALRLLRLVNALLDFSRAEAGRMEAEFHPTDIGRLTAALAETFREACERAGVDLVVACDTPSEPVYLDRDLWERIVLNLVSNAFKATLEGEIRVQLRAAPDGVELAVSDTGTGIPPEELDRLFQRFHRVRAVARSYEGTGIGLALVKQLTELHRGEVTAESELGRGSRFVVRIPYGSAHLPPDQVHEEPLEPAASIAPLFVEEALTWADGTAGPARDGAGLTPLVAGGFAGGDRPRVLIADDNPDLRRYLSSLLSGQFHVTTVGDGEAAMAEIHRSRPDLLISDVMMPRMDGYALLGVLRSAPGTQDLPVILLSARAGEEAALEGLAAGADDYLAKPFSGRELLARVRAHVDLARLRRQAAADVRAERRRLEQTLRQLPAGVLLAEAPSGRVVLGNAQAAEILGQPLHRPSGLEEYREAYPLFSPEGAPLALAERPMARAIGDGEVVEDEDVLYRTDAGRLVNLRISAAPIRDEAGEIVAGVLVFQDVSERVRSQRLLVAQRDLLALIATGEPLPVILAAIARTAEQLSAVDARAAIMLVSADGRRLEPGAAPSLGDDFLRAAQGLDIGARAGTLGRAAATGESVVSLDLRAEPAWEELRDAAERHGLRAAWSTPIRADDGELVGVFGLLYGDPREPDPEDRRVVDLLAGTAGVAIGRARDAANRARRLSELQSSLLPRKLPEVPGLGAAVTFRPADRGLEVGGDFYDMFPLPDGAWGFVIGDVTGHGSEAAAVTALTRNTVRVVARMERRPARVLELVNEELLRSDYDRFCTAQFGRLEPVDGGGFELALACGGHPPALVRRASGEVESLRDHGPLLGMFVDAGYPECRVRLQTGDALVLYTDGLIERNPRLEGEAGLRRLLRSLDHGDVEGLLADLEAHALGAPAERLPDDAAVLVLQVSAAAGGAVADTDAGVRAAA